jgi:transcriptional regulator with XRE-family HTH domain
MFPSERARIRKRAGLTQLHLAKLTGISQTRLSFWENYERELSPEELQHIVRVLHQRLSAPKNFRRAIELAHALAPRRPNNEETGLHRSPQTKA